MKVQDTEHMEDMASKVLVEGMLTLSGMLDTQVELPQI
jgi:hypothetical protein